MAPGDGASIALSARGDNGPGAAGEDISLLQSPPPIQIDEIIPLVSSVLPPSRAATMTAAARGGGRDAAAGDDHLTTGGAPGVTAATHVKRGGGKDRGKDRDGGGAGGGDGEDDSPAASESGSDWSDDDRNVCSICMDLPVAVLVAGGLPGQRPSIHGPGR